MRQAVLYLQAHLITAVPQRSGVRKTVSAFLFWYHCSCPHDRREGTESWAVRDFEASRIGLKITYVHNTVC